MPNNAKKSPPRRKSPPRNGTARPSSPVRNGIGRPRSPKRRSPPSMRTPSPMRLSRSKTVLIQNMFGGRRANVNMHNLVTLYNYLRTTPNGLNVYMRKR